MKLRVYGRKMEILKKNGRWILFFLGSEGKKRELQGFVIPSEYNESQAITYMADLFHEWSSPEDNDVNELKD